MEAKRFNIFSAEFGTHATPSMSIDQRRRADRWALPAGVAGVVLLVAVLFEQQGWLDPVPEILHTAVIAFWLVEAAALLRLSPDDREWLARNKIDLLAIVGGIATLPFMPDPLPGYAPLVAGLRAFDLFGVYTRYWRITPARFFALCYLLALYVGAVAFAELERIPDTGATPTLLEGFYWASVTLPSIGYGDFSPHTHEAQVLALIYLPVTFLLIPLAFWSLQGVMDREVEDLSIIRDRARGGDLHAAPFEREAEVDTAGRTSRDDKLDEILALLQERGGPGG